MDLVRSWLGQALRATGAAVVVPVAILAALSVTAVGGDGLGGLGGLSQIVSGPQVSGSGVSVDDGDSEIADAVTQLAAGGPGAAGPAPVGGAPPPGTADSPGGGAPPSGQLPPSGNGDGNGPGGGDIDDPTGGGDPPPPGPPPPPPPPPGVVEGVGQGVKDITSGTPVSPTVEDAVDALVETCGRLGCP